MRFGAQLRLAARDIGRYREIQGSMACTRSGVVLATREALRSSAALGSERPEPRWSKQTMR